jgi:hypothetical protein
VLHRRAFLTLGLAAGAAAVTVDRWPTSHPGPPLSQTARWGAFATPEPYPDCSAHYELEALVGGPLQLMSWFVQWNMDFPRAAVETKAKGYDLLIAWEPIVNGQAIPFADILTGHWDAYIMRFLLAAKAYGHQVTLRFCHEMNLGKAPWCVGRGGPASTSEFVAVWRRVFNLKATMDAPNVQMLWCIAEGDGPIPADEYFPGLDYVEKVGFDVYSGYTAPGWKEPAQLLRRPYERLSRLAPKRPVWVCEIGCRQPARFERHDKAEWYTKLFNVTGLAGLTNICFFNSDKEQDWRVNSSAAVLSAVREGLAARPIPA